MEDEIAHPPSLQHKDKFTIFSTLRGKIHDKKIENKSKEKVVSERQSLQLSQKIKYSMINIFFLLHYLYFCY